MYNSDVIDLVNKSVPMRADENKKLISNLYQQKGNIEIVCIHAIYFRVNVTKIPYELLYSIHFFNVDKNSCWPEFNVDLLFSQPHILSLVRNISATSNAKLILADKRSSIESVN